MTPHPVDSKTPSSPPQAEEGELFRATLAAVSRSFYLTLRFLPGRVRRPMALGYLLARLSDTVADSAAAPVEKRLALLARMEAVLEGGRWEPSLATGMKGLAASVPDEGERRLLEQAEALFQLYATLDEADRGDVRWVLSVIISGQRLDLERSVQGGALRTAEELEDYTWRVAGCVGEFWTRVCFRHIEDYSDRPMEEMLPLGVGLGKALQLVNILRDAPADLRAGRCYLPLEDLEAVGISREGLLREPEGARAVVARWEARCGEQLEMGYSYLAALRPWRLRLACFLPWALARRTLRMMQASPPLESPQRVKVPRAEVWQMVGWGLLVAGLPGLLGRVARRF